MNMIIMARESGYVERERERKSRDFGEVGRNMDGVSLGSQTASDMLGVTG